MGLERDVGTSVERDSSRGNEVDEVIGGFEVSPWFKLVSSASTAFACDLVIGVMLDVKK